MNTLTYKDLENMMEWLEEDIQQNRLTAMFNPGSILSLVEYAKNLHEEVEELDEDLCEAVGLLERAKYLIFHVNEVERVNDSWHLGAEIWLDRYARWDSKNES